MMVRCLLLAVCAAVLIPGCKKEARPVEGPPLRIEFGDCVADATFVSGPRPAPYDEGRLAVLGKPEPEPEPPALDEGKMGKIDSQRETGQYQMKKNAEDAQLTRKQTIEAAREAGILGANLENSPFETLTGTADFSSGLEDRDVFGDEVGEMQGGFGTGHVGPGGGGTGWGTIGTGKYGTIGHGSGTGSGYGTGSGRGGMRGRTNAAPEVRIGNAAVAGDLDKNIIRRYIRRKLPQIKHCYEKQLLATPALMGTVVTQFTVQPNGTTADVTAEGLNDAASDCVANVIRTIQFPKPRDGGLVKVRYPFSFRPGGNATAPVADKDMPAAGAAPRPADTNYVPGADSPLRAHGTALETCFRKHKKPYGVAVLELAFGDGGAVTTATAHGDLGDALSTCLADAAKKARWEAASGSTKRCSIAVGNATLDQPLGSTGGPVPLVDIDATQVTYRGAPITPIAAIVADESPEWRITPLYEAARAERTRLESSKELVAVSGPAMVRPIGTTPMKVVYRAYRSLTTADLDTILAAQRDTAWAPLTAVELPVVPVPRGTGTRWQRDGHARNAMADFDPPVRLSVMVTPNHYWVGVSQVQELTQIDRSTPDAEASLREVLAKTAGLPYRKDLTDVELGATDEVSYADFIALFDITTAAGLTDWRVIPPPEMTVRFPE